MARAHFSWKSRMRSAIACALGAILSSSALCAQAQLHDASRSLTLEQLLRSMATSAGVSAQFEERKELALLSAPLESRGRLYFEPPDRFARFTTGPAVTALVIDGERVHFRESSDAEALDLSGNPMTRAFVENFIALWSGDRARLERLYDVTLAGDRARWELSLAPRAGPLDRFIERITLRGREAALTQMIVRETDGDRTVTEFAAMRLDRAFSADERQQIFARGVPLDEPAEAR